MKKHILILAAVLATNLAGCAAVLNGTHTSYRADSSPTGASVRFSNETSCTTPWSLEFRRKDDLRADVTMAGYKPTNLRIQSKLAASAFEDIILGGVVGGVVGGSNGASNQLHPRPLFVRLAPEGSSEGALFLDEKGNAVKTVNAYDDSVRADVAKTVGPRLAGLEGSDPQ